MWCKSIRFTVLSMLRSPKVRGVLSLLVVVATLAVFGWYLATHPEVVDTLLDLSPWVLIALTVAYALTIVVNALVLHWSLAYVERSTPLLDNALLTGYSSIVNFFGPLQSGPGFRAVYLKQRYKVEITRFLAATAVFYLFFAAFNGAVVMIAAAVVFPEWRVAIAAVVVLGLALIRPAVKIAGRTERGRMILDAIRFDNRYFWLTGLGAVLLSLATSLAYGTEIAYVTDGVSPWQVAVYTAVANLSLFVALTPGAIGFREAFLLFSIKLHGISPDVIAAVSIIDRAFYVVFLLVMFFVLLAVNSRKRLSIFTVTSRPPSE